MNPSADPDFDRRASSYEEELLGSFPAVFSENLYFAEYKVKFIARRLAGRPGPRRILDFGCGIGRSLEYFAASFPGAELWGYDPSVESVEAARRRVRGVTLTSDAAELPSAGFDCIMAANVLHHVPPSERKAVLASYGRLLSPEGRVFVFEHNPWNPVTRLIFERCPCDRGARMLRKSEVLRTAADAGLEPVHSSYTLFFPKQLSALRPLERGLGWLPLGAQYCVELGRRAASRV